GGAPGGGGSGTGVGAGAGGGPGSLDGESLWRFLSPPPALVHGILVDRAGLRICDESRYGAAIGDAIVRRPGARAWLLLDEPTLALARGQVRGTTLWFQRLQARYLLTRGRHQAPTLDAVARRAGIDPAGLEATVAAPNATAPGGRAHRDGRGGGAAPGGQAGRPGPRPGPAAVLADRLLGAALGGQPRPGAHARRPGRRGGHRAGATA